ncbi:MAG TPA: hypothetical protein VGB30_05985 [bacterium]|jgi:hypothetical protein
MKATRSFLALLIVSLLFVFGCGGGSSNPIAPSTADQNSGLNDSSKVLTALDFGEGCETDLIAGQFDTVGSVSFTYDENYIYITYTVDPGYCINEIHAHIGTSLADFPLNKAGNPVLGQFDCSEEFDECVTEYTCTFDNTYEDGDVVLYSAHAVVTYPDGTQETAFGGECYDFPGNRWGWYCECELEICEYDLNLTLPETVCVIHTYPAPDSYWGIELYDVEDGYSVSDGNYLGWCCENTVTLSPGNRCDVEIFSSYEDDLPNMYGEDDWNRINYILNHKPDGATIMEIQKAIWHYTDGLVPDNPTTQAIVDDADANGGDYEPGVGDVIAVILFIGENNQCTFFEVPVVCED